MIYRLSIIMMELACLANPAVAAEKWDFGQFAYGATITSKPESVIDWDCSSIDWCGFSDAQSVRYATMDDHRIYFKEFAVRPDNHQLIPYGVDYNSSPDDIVKTISEQVGTPLVCGMQTGEINCLADITSSVFISVTFNGRQHLKTIDLNMLIGTVLPPAR